MQVLFVLLFCIWCSLVDGEVSNDVIDVIKELQSKVSTLERSMAKQHDIIDHQWADIEDLTKNEVKQCGINEKLREDAEKSKESEKTLKLEIGKLREDLKKLNSSTKSLNHTKSLSSTMVGKSKESPAKSCKWLKENSSNLNSGLFWIALKTPTQVYCDMEEKNNGGGWTMVGQAEAKTDSEGTQIEFAKILSHDTSELSKVMNKRFLLSGEGLRELQKYIDFTQIRFYCHKPWHGRTLHIYTLENDLGKGVVNLLTEKSDRKPKSCDSFARMSDDNSVIGTHCSGWYEHTWNVNSVANVRMYNNPMMVFPGGTHCLVLRPGRHECDDYVKDGNGYNKIGRWAFYVR